MSSILRYALDDFKSRDPDTPDPIWELVGHYRRVCQDKHALQVGILRELDALEREAELEVERARMALAETRTGRQVTGADRNSSAAWDRGNHKHWEKSAITGPDGPREDPIQHGAAAVATLPVSVLPSIFPAASAPDVGRSRLPADGSVFEKYDKMIAALRTRSPPITLSFIPREEIPWPLLPPDGIFPVALSGNRGIELDKLAEFAAGYALWRDKPLGKTLNILLGHWIAMDKRMKNASEHMEQGAPEPGPEVSQTRRWIANVRSKLFAIVAEQDPSVFINYEELMTLLAQGGYQPPPFPAIPWPILPGPGEHYPVPASGRGVKHRQIDRFVRGYSTWKSCSKADICARMLPEWEALSASIMASDAKTKKCITAVVTYLAESA